MATDRQRWCSVYVQGASMMHRPAVEEVVLSRPTGCKSNCGHEVLLDTMLGTGRQRAQQVTEVSPTKAQVVGGATVGNG